jgi:sec-independent protein translocase protein TatA
MLSGMELIILALAGVALLIWGPNKIPELAKGLGRAKAEFDKASRGEYTIGSPVGDNVRSTSNDDSLIVIALSLGLKTEGRTREQILQEIVTNVKANKTSS